MAIIDKPKPAAESGDWLVWKHPSEVLRLGAQLNIGPSQEVLVVKGGRALDLFAPGKYTLSASNLPLLDQTINFTTSRKTQFIAQLWYVETHPLHDLSWATPAPVMVLDPVHNLSVHLQFQGRWAGRVRDTRAFVTQVLATLKEPVVEKVTDHLTGLVANRFAELLPGFFAHSKSSVADAPARLNDLSAFIAEQLRPELGQLGWELTLFQVDRFSAPDDVMKKLRELAAQKAERDRLAAAAQPTPVAPVFTATTVATGQSGETSFYALRPVAPPPEPPAAPPLAPATASDPVAKLKKLKQLLDSGLITQQDFDTRKQKILDEI
ncbi:MAG: SPFH domain-containing protein [Verrucomicrobia bacterium]|nr:SPFH domain-containing protein [Verrucomicrobiota bacterium]